MRTMATQLNRFAMILHCEKVNEQAIAGKRERMRIINERNKPKNAQNSIDNETNKKNIPVPKLPIREWCNRVLAVFALQPFLSC